MAYQGNYPPSTPLVSNQIGAGVVTGSNIASATITGSNIAASTVAVSNLSATGTPGATNYLRGDGTWSEVGLATGEILTSIASSKTGYLLCDGSAYTRTSYPTLAAAIGTPLAPVNTLGNALSGSTAFHQTFEANGVLFRSNLVQTANNTALANGLQTSTDGITWTSRTGMNVGPGATLNFGGNAVSYGNSVYVVLQPNPTASASGQNYPYWQTSPDAVTFTTRSGVNYGNTYSNVQPVDTCFGGTSNRHVMAIVWYTYSGFCAGYSNSNVRLAYSSDGITWTTGDTNTWTTTTGSFTYAQVAGYSGGFVSIASRSDGTNYIKYSADGATWTDITTNVASVAAVNGQVSSVGYANGRFIITTNKGQLYTSTTGASGTWSQIVVSGTVASGLYKVRGNSNAFVVNQSGVKAFFSTDLINWVAAQDLGLGNIAISATPASGSRFYGNVSYSAANFQGSYYADLYNYTAATQFVTPKFVNFGGSPTTVNSVSVNYLIKT